jgi:hypothetical protein
MNACSLQVTDIKAIGWVVADDGIEVSSTYTTKRDDHTMCLAGVIDNWISAYTSVIYRDGVVIQFTQYNNDRSKS